MDNTHLTTDEFLQKQESLPENRLEHLSNCSECGAIARTVRETRVPEGLDVRKAVGETINAYWRNRSPE